MNPSARSGRRSASAVSAFCSSRSALVTAEAASSSFTRPLPSCTSFISRSLFSTRRRAASSSSWFWSAWSLRSSRVFTTSASAWARRAWFFRISSSKGAASKRMRRSPFCTSLPSGAKATILAWLLWMVEAYVTERRAWRVPASVIETRNGPSRTSAEVRSAWAPPRAHASRSEQPRPPRRRPRERAGDGSVGGGGEGGEVLPRPLLAAQPGPRLAPEPGDLARRARGGFGRAAKGGGDAVVTGRTPSGRRGCRSSA